MLDWESVHAQRHSVDHLALAGCTDVIALGFRLKIPVLSDCVLRSASDHRLLIQRQLDEGRAV